MFKEMVLIMNWVWTKMMTFELSLNVPQNGGLRTTRTLWSLFLHGQGTLKTKCFFRRNKTSMKCSETLRQVFEQLFVLLVGAIKLLINSSYFRDQFSILSGCLLNIAYRLFICTYKTYQCLILHDSSTSLNLTP